jgi:hypothetical protein
MHPTFQIDLKSIIIDSKSIVNPEVYSPESKAVVTENIPLAGAEMLFKNRLLFFG